MPTISELRHRVTNALSSTLTELGFSPAGDATFFIRSPDALQLAEIAFLDRRHAAYFGSNTAGFGLELGVYYTFIPPAENPMRPLPHDDAVPKIFECHIRATLRRDFRQVAPGENLSNPDKLRRDIWWVDATGSYLDQVLSGAIRVLRRKATAWLNRFSDARFAYRYLRWAPGTLFWAGAPINIGVRGSPYRQALMRHLLNRWKQQGR